MYIHYMNMTNVKQMKRDLFFESQSEYFDKKQLLEIYTQYKNYDYLKKLIFYI